MKLFTRRTREDKNEVTKADKVWLHSIITRQRMVVEDLEKFASIYGDRLDREVVGSLISVYEMLRDNSESIIYGREVGSMELSAREGNERMREYR